MTVAAWWYVVGLTLDPDITPADAERFDTFYRDVHAPEVLRHNAGFTGCTRWRVTRRDPATEPGPDRLACYSLAGEVRCGRLPESIGRTSADVHSETRCLASARPPAVARLLADDRAGRRSAGPARSDCPVAHSHPQPAGRGRGSSCTTTCPQRPHRGSSRCTAWMVSGAHRSHRGGSSCTPAGERAGR